MNVNIQITEPLSTATFPFLAPTATIELAPGDKLMVILAGKDKPVIRMRLSEDGLFLILADTPDDQNRGGKISKRLGTRPEIYEIAGTSLRKEINDNAND